MAGQGSKDGERRDGAPANGTQPAGWAKNLRPFAFFAALAVISGISVYLLRGGETFVRVFWENLDFVLVILPRIAAAVLLAGFIQVLVPRDVVARWLGEKSGFKGLVVAALAGVVTPGGPMTSFPLVLALYASGAERGALVSYLTAWSLLGVQRILIWEIPLLGSDFTLIRFTACAALPLVAGVIARKLPIRLDPPPREEA